MAELGAFLVVFGEMDVYFDGPLLPSVSIGLGIAANPLFIQIHCHDIFKCAVLQIWINRLMKSLYNLIYIMNKFVIIQVTLIGVRIEK